MSDMTYAEMMKLKRKRATRNGIFIGGVALSFFLFPLAFVTWKNSQGTEGMLVNKTMAGPGMRSVPLYKHELETGEAFSPLVASHSKAQFEGLLERPDHLDGSLSPKEQYKQFKQQQQQRHVE